MQKITPNLWFDTQAEEAAKLYTSLFPDSKILNVSHYPEEATEVAGMPAGSVMTVEFELAGQQFLALNGGPQFKFTEAISLMVDCKDQEEVDHYWNALTADGGEESMCGWLKDKFGLSWQITPTVMNQFASDPDPKKSGAAMKAMLGMKKLDIAKLQEAYDNA